MTGATTRSGTLSIIVPALNEAAVIEAVLGPLQAWRAAGVEVLVVDGGSSDATVALALPLADRVIKAERGRARQMNAGAVAASGAALLFLHADTMLPEGAPGAVLAAICAQECLPPTVSGQAPGGPFDSMRVWGRFDVRIAGQSRMLPVVAWCMNLRSRLSGIATGDQAIFMLRAAYDAVGGFPDQPLMEDIEICRRLKRLGPPVCLNLQVQTSGRRWETRGVWRTIFLMWRLRLAYFFGVSVEYLARAYR